MKKTKIRIFATLLMAVLCMTAFSTTAFAGGGEDTATPPPVTEPKEETPLVPLAPEGNLTLVDDVERADEIDKQFITAVSKNGNYFYLVIDRAGKEDNDLTTLQREANKLLGFTAEQTLQYTQSLYEKKYITYPRTDSRFLTEDMENGISVLAKATAGFLCPMLPSCQ